MSTLYPSPSKAPRRPLLPLLMLSLLCAAIPTIGRALSIPTIISVTGPSAGTYLTGQSLSFTVNFDAAVTVTGTPQLSLTIEATARQASYVSGSGGTSLVFSYTVQPTDGDTNGITVSSPLALNGGTIQNSGVNASLTFTPPATTGVLVGLQRARNAPINLFARPGGVSYTWRIANGSNGAEAPTAILDYEFDNVTAFGWNLTRGHVEYSSDGGATWTAFNSASPTYIPVAGKTWRYVDTTPGDPTTMNNVGNHWHLVATPGSTTGTGAGVYPDNPPTDITSSKSTVFSSALSGEKVATLTPTDTGDTTGGAWVIDSQSVANLFTIAYDNTTGNTATLKVGTGVMPAIGQTPTVTVRYYDVFQTDRSGVPISGQGFSKTLSYTVVSEVSNDLTLGNDTPVNTYTANDQSAPALAALSNGNVAVVWQSGGQGGKNFPAQSGIYGQLISSTGSPVGSEFVISNAGPAVNETTPAVTALANGRFVVAYAESPGTAFDIGYRIVEANGTVGPQLIANATTTGDQYAPAIATLTDGSFVIAWYSQNGEIRSRQFAAATGNPVGGETLFNSNAYYVAATALSNGGFAVAWADMNTGEIKVAVNGGSTVATGIFTAYYAPPRLAGLVGGGFVLASESYNSVTNQSQIDVARFNNSGAIQGAKFQANTISTGNRFAASVAALTGGGFVVGWTADNGDFDVDGIFGRRFTSTATAVDAVEFEINQHRSGDQVYPAITALPSDAFAAVWTYVSNATLAANLYEGDVYARALLTSAPPPTITNVTSSQANGSYKAGTVIPITVTFNSSVTVTGNPTLALNSGGSAAYASGSPGTALTFNYTVAAAQTSSDLDYSATTSLALAGGTINATSGGTAATLTLPSPGAAGSLGANKALVIDTTAPTILSINRFTPAGQTTGSSTVTFRVVYSEPVSGMSNSSFAVVAVNGSNIVGNVTGVSVVNATTCDVTVNVASGTGDFRLRGVN